MQRRWLLLIGLLLVILSSAPLYAQDAPQPMNAALNDLSGRVGRNVGLLDLEKWSYVGSNYPSPALGCPQSGVAYADVITPGYQFILTYNGSEYDYRVSNDQTIIILCGTSATAPTTPLCPPANDPSYLPPRLSIGAQGRVGTGGLPNLLRDQPGSSGNAVGQIPPGDIFTVQDGPRCSLLDKVVWWQVNYNGLIGWTAEGKDGEYWLEPLDLPTPTQPTLEIISTGNAAALDRVYASTNAVIALSPTGPTVASGDGSGNITLFDFLANTQLSAKPAHSGAVTSLVFGYNPIQLLNLLASGGADGVVKIWEVSSQGSLTQKVQVSAHNGAVSALAFSNRGTLLVTGGADGKLRLWDAATGNLLKELAVHNGPVEEVRFGAADNGIISRDNSGSVVISAVVSGTAIEAAG
ncbi:MAG: SH3 domain-containing protein [Anaerolineae bacterium]